MYLKFLYIEMHINMYMSMYLRVICIYAYIYVYIYIHIYLYTYTCINTSTILHIFFRIHIGREQNNNPISDIDTNIDMHIGKNTSKSNNKTQSKTTKKKPVSGGRKKSKVEDQINQNILAALEECESSEFA
jgi:hypothetical protein